MRDNQKGRLLLQELRTKLSTSKGLEYEQLVLTLNKLLEVKTRAETRADGENWFNGQCTYTYMLKSVWTYFRH